MEKRKQTIKPPKPTGLDYILADPMTFVSELRDIVREANIKRGSVLVEALEYHHPDLYYFAESLVDISPEQAREALISRFPWLGLGRIYRDHLNVISFLQERIKERRSQKNGRRQITRRSIKNIRK